MYLFNFIMKKSFLLGCGMMLFAMSSNAQKTVVTTKSFSDTQARMLEVTAKSYVRPLIVDLNVVGPRTIFPKDYTITEFEVAMGGNLDNLRSRVIYDASTAWKCDAVVAATFKIEFDADKNIYNVEMKGFPANFDQSSWHPMNEKDYQWLEVDKMVSSNDNNRAGAVIRDVKK